MFSYPLQVHPCRASVDAVLRWRPGRRSDHHSPIHSPSRPPKSSIKPRSDSMGEARFAIITTAIIIFSYLVAMTISSLETVLAYVGSTGSTSISFILPGLFYHKISSPDSPHHQKLMKEDDDEEDDEDDDGGGDGSRADGGGSNAEAEGLLSRSVATRFLRSGPSRRRLLRRLSLALAIYGIVVMVVCLITNTVFSVSH